MQSNITFRLKTIWKFKYVVVILLYIYTFSDRNKTKIFENVKKKKQVCIIYTIALAEIFICNW